MPGWATYGSVIQFASSKGQMQRKSSIMTLFNWTLKQECFSKLKQIGWYWKLSCCFQTKVEKSEKSL